MKRNAANLSLDASNFVCAMLLLVSCFLCVSVSPAFSSARPAIPSFAVTEPPTPLLLLFDASDCTSCTQELGEKREKARATDRVYRASEKSSKGQSSRDGDSDSGRKRRSESPVCV